MSHLIFKMFSMNGKKLLKCFITNITTNENEIEIWSQIDTKTTSRLKTSIKAIHKQMSEEIAIKS